MVSRDGHVKVMDFVCGPRGGASQTATGVPKGKLAYMAPEQANDQELDHRVDQFALGLLLWELAVGKLPIERMTRFCFGKFSLEIFFKFTAVIYPKPFVTCHENARKAPEDRFEDMDAVYRAALQVRFSLGESGATASLAGLLGESSPPKSQLPASTTLSHSQTAPAATSTLLHDANDSGAEAPETAVISSPERPVQPTEVTRFDAPAELLGRSANARSRRARNVRRHEFHTPWSRWCSGISS